MTKIERYIWLIKLLQEKRGITFEEIYNEWIKTRKIEIIPSLEGKLKNPFQRIREMFSLQKERGFHNNWYIAYSEEDVLSKKELLSVFEMLNEIVHEIISSKSMYKSLFDLNNYDLIYENIVMKVLNAMNTKRKIRFETIVSLDSRDKYEVLTVAPYQLDFINNKWYIIGQTDESGLMRIPLLFYYGEAHITDNTYMYPDDYSHEAYSKMIYGTTNDRQHLTIWIQDSILEKKDICIYPLMPFLQKIENGSWDKKGILFSRQEDSLVRVYLDLPKTAFSVYTLQRALRKLDFRIDNNLDPFSLFTAEQYEVSRFEPVVLKEEL